MTFTLAKSNSSESINSTSSMDVNGLSWPSQGAKPRRNESPEKQEERIKKIANHVKEILILLGENPNRDGILKTPERYAKALLFLTRGYQQNLQIVVNDAISEENHDEMVIVRDIETNLLCEHHMVTKISRLPHLFRRRYYMCNSLNKFLLNAFYFFLFKLGINLFLYI